MTVGGRIKAARKKAAMTQKDLGDALGISFQTVAQWETGRRKPKFETIEKIAAALNADVFEIYYGDPPEAGITKDFYSFPPEQRKSLLVEFDRIEQSTANIGKNIQEMWETRGYTAEEVSVMTGWPIKELEDLKNRPNEDFRLRELLQFSAALNCFWADLVGNDDRAAEIWMNAYPEKFTEDFANDLPRQIREWRGKYYASVKLLNGFDGQSQLKDAEALSVASNTPARDNDTDNESKEDTVQNPAGEN